MHLSRKAKVLLVVAAFLLVVQFVALSLIGDVTLAATVGAYTLALLALAAVVPALAGAQPLAPRPELEVRLELDGPTVASSQLGAWWIDVEAITKEQLKRAWGTAPARPGATRGVGRADGVLRSPRMTLILGAVEPLDEALHERFAKRVDSYEQKLREWLGGLEQPTWERSCQLSVRLVVGNVSSRAPARDLDADLELAPGLVPDEGPTDCDTPPRRPSYEGGRSTASLAAMAAISIPRITFPISNPSELRDTPGGEGRRWSVSGLPTVLHAGASESSRRLELNVEAPGRHELVATVRALDLDRAVKETLVLEIPTDRAPERRLATLGKLCEFLEIEIEKEGERPRTRYDRD